MAGQELAVGARFRQFNITLVFVMFYMGSCAFNFGFDVGNFSSVQAMTAFAKQFGKCNKTTGTCALPGWLSSLMTSLPFFGKALGAIACGPIAERWGRKKAVLVLAILSLIGVLLETTATTAAQFTIGRFIAFAMTGMTIIVVPIYQGEISPKVLRGMMTSTLQLMIVFGQVVASLVCLGTKTIPSNASWRIPVGLQFVAPSIIVALLPFMPESPRWLLSQSRNEDAKRELTRLHRDSTEADIDFEIEALRHAQSIERKGSWAEVFNKANRTRTMVAVFVMFGQQITGQAFASQYSVVFFQAEGFAAKSFLFNVLANVCGLVCLFITWFIIDQVGRRTMLMVGGSGMAIFMFIIGAIGVLEDPTGAQKNTLVAAFILYTSSYNVSWAPCSYVVVSEAASTHIREKTNLFAGVISILTTFVTTFTVPYLLKAPYADLGAKVGFIYGSLCTVMVVAAFFLIPELKGRTLEEVDQLFASGRPLREFGTMQTKSVGDEPRQEFVVDEKNAVFDSERAR